MTYLYQNNLDLVYSSNEEHRRELGRITRQKMLALKTRSACIAPKTNPLTQLNQALSMAFCFIFRPRLAAAPVRASRTTILSEKTN